MMKSNKPVPAAGVHFQFLLKQSHAQKKCCPSWISPPSVHCGRKSSQGSGRTDPTDTIYIPATCDRSIGTISILGNWKDISANLALESCTLKQSFPNIPDPMSAIPALTETHPLLEISVGRELRDYLGDDEFLYRGVPDRPKTAVDRA